MRATFAAFSESMVNTTTMLVHTKALVSAFLCQGQNGAQNARYIGEISWEASSKITTGSLQLRSQGVVDIFTLYRLCGPLPLRQNPSQEVGGSDRRPSLCEVAGLIVSSAHSKGQQH